MRTKFILHGGSDPKQENEDYNDFFKEVLKDAPENAKALLVPFAKDADRVVAATEKITHEFDKNKGYKSINIEIATEENFITQLQSADVVYFHGGVSLKLLEALRKYQNLDKFLKGKIIAGESAGANVWSKFFYSPHADSVFEGIGILPVKIIPHYKKEHEGKLDNVDPGLETLLLHEYEYKIFYK